MSAPYTRVGQDDSLQDISTIELGSMSAGPNSHPPLVTGREKEKQPLSVSITEEHEDTSSNAPDKTPTTESPKPVLNGGLSRLFHGWLLHVPAVVISVMLVWMSRTKLFWYPEEGPQNVDINPVVIGNLLQIAAKVHEILVVGSLATVCLSLFRRRLVSEGVRLGFLTGGYRVGDIWYLTSGAFWRHGTLKALSPWEQALAGFLVLSTILSLIIGPSSAILLVPSLGWYSLDGAFENVKMPLKYEAYHDEVWPIKLSKDLWVDSCDGGMGILSDTCPAGGFAVFRKWVDSAPSTKLEEGPIFQDASSNLIRQISIATASTVENDENPVTLATTPSAFSVQSFGLFTRYLRSNNIGSISNTQRFKLNTTTTMLQPFVQAKCVVFDLDEVQRTNGSGVVFPTESLNCYGDTDCLWHTQERQAVPLENLETFPEAWPMISASANISSSVFHFTGLLPYSARKGESIIGGYWVYACSTTARWVPSALSIDPSVDDVVRSNLSKEVDMQEIFKADGVNMGGSVLRYFDSWMDYVNPLLNITQPQYVGGKESNEERPTSALKMIVSRFALLTTTANGTEVPSFISSDITKQDAQGMLARTYATWFADTLARLGSNFVTTLVLEDTETSVTMAWLNTIASTKNQMTRFAADSLDEIAVLYHDTSSDEGVLDWHNRTMRQMHEMYDAVVAMDFDVERYGYGSGQDSKTLWFALSMIMAYLVIIGLYAIVVTSSALLELLTGLGGRSRFILFSVSAWSDLQDITLLALRSSPPDDADLANVGGGASTSKVWQKVVKIRATEDDAVELVIGDHEGLSSLRRGVKYT